MMDDFSEKALAVIDAAMARWGGRELVSSGEAVDLLLDLRVLVCSCDNCDDKETVS